EPSQELGAACDQVRRSDDRGQARFAQELGERVSVVLAEGDNLMQDRGQFLRLVVERILEEIQGQLRLPLCARDLGRDGARYGVKYRALGLLGLRLWLVLVWVDALVSPGLDLLTSLLPASGVEVIADRPTHGLPERSRVAVGHVLHPEQRELLVREPLPGDVRRVRALLRDSASSRLEREMVRVRPEVQGVVLPRAPLDDPHRRRVLVVLTKRHRSGGVVRDLFLGVERGAVVRDRQLAVVEQDWSEVSPKLRDDILRVERTQRQLPVVMCDEDRASL